MVKQKKEMPVYRSAWQKMTSSRDHRYNQQTQARTKRKEFHQIETSLALSQRSIKRKEIGRQI